MEKEEYIKLSWPEAKAAGVSRADWCDAMADKRGKDKHAPPTKKKVVLKARTTPLQIYSCKHRGDVVGMTVCSSCGGGKRPLEIFECTVHGNCTVDKMAEPDGPHVKGLCKLCKNREDQLIIE